LHGATEDSIKIMTSIAHKANKKVKASGGIRDGITAMKYINLGSDRLGTSATVKIYNEILDILNNTNNVIKDDTYKNEKSSY